MRGHNFRVLAATFANLGGCGFAATEGKTVCALPAGSEWVPWAPWERQALTLTWRDSAATPSWRWAAVQGVPFEVHGAARGDGPLCPLADELPFQVQPIARVFLCEECVDGCVVGCYPERVSENTQQCEMSLNTSCVHLEKQVPADIEAEWRREVDPLRIAMFVIGVIFVLYATPLSSSSLIHKAMGAFLGVALSLLLIVWFFWRQARDTIPFARYYLALLNLVLFIAPSLGFYLLHTFAPSYTWGLRMSQQFLLFQEPYFGVPVGLLFTLASILFGMYVGNRVFGDVVTDEDLPPSSAVNFCISPSGQRVDSLPSAPNTQVGLEWFLWSCGILLLLRCSTERSLNVCLLVAVLSWETLLHWFKLWRMRQEHGLSPASLHSKLISQEDYIQQTKSTTERELEKLRKVLRSSGSKYYGLMSTEHELRVRRFTEGGNHIDSVSMFDFTPRRSDGWFGRCAVM